MHTITVSDLFAKLAAIAPSIAFSVTKEFDPHERWDGDGPDPRDEGFDPYDITVTARAIVAGQLIEGDAYMGGHWMKPEQETGSLGGYLLQMLDEAVTNLWEGRQRGSMSAAQVYEIDMAHAYLRNLMREEYDAQRAGAPLLSPA